MSFPPPRQKPAKLRVGYCNLRQRRIAGCSCRRRRRARPTARAAPPSRAWVLRATSSCRQSAPPLRTGSTALKTYSRSYYSVNCIDQPYLYSRPSTKYSIQLNRSIVLSSIDHYNRPSQVRCTKIYSIQLKVPFLCRFGRSEGPKVLSANHRSFECHFVLVRWTLRPAYAKISAKMAKFKCINF